MTPSPERIAELRAKATAAPYGPLEADNIAVRTAGPNGRQICLCEISDRGRPYNETYDEAVRFAAFIAACDPDTILSLLAALEARTKALEPFAKIEPSSFYPADGSEGEKYWVLLHTSSDGHFDFTGADLARARAALAGQEERA